jgi:hypothetical protein
MKNTGPYIAIVVAIVIMAGGCNYALRKQYEKEISDLKYQLAHAQQYVPMEKDTVYLPGDTVEVSTSPVIMAELKTLRKQHLIDERMIKDLDLKLKQLDAVQTTVTETKDTARAEYCHNIKVFSYDDRWSHLEFSLSDSTFYYNIRDSLATVVYHEYKHRFLWWRWGVKGYKVKVVNFNPHSTIRYNTFVKPEK